MNTSKCTAAGEIELLESNQCKSGGLFVRAHEHNRVVSELRIELEKLRKSKRRDEILTEAMAEIYATIQGQSDQPIERIVDGCRKELFDVQF